MPIQISKDRTDAYIGTFHYADAGDMLQLAEVRKMVSNLNKSLKSDGYEYRFRVSLRGRLGKNNPNAEKYRHAGNYHGFGGHPYQMIKLADASHVDAYIHKERK